MKSFLLSLEYLILTHIWENCLLQFLFLSSVKSHEFPTAVCLMRNSFQEHYSHQGEIKSIWINKQERIFHFAVIRCTIFFKIQNKFFNITAFGFINVANFKLYCSNHESFLPILNFLLCFFFGASSFSFRYTSSGMISVWYNLHLDLTLSQTSSDDKILSTVGKTFGNAVFKALDAWSVRLEIPPNAFASLRFMGVCSSNSSEKCWEVILSSYEWQCLCMMISNSVEIPFLLHTY